MVSTFAISMSASSCEFAKKRRVICVSEIRDQLSTYLDRSKRFTLFAFPGRPVHSDTVLGFILAMQQLRATTKSLTFPPLSIARYSFIQLSRQGRQRREGKCQIFQTVAKGDSNPGSLDCESGTELPRSTHTLGFHGYSLRKRNP